MAEEGVIRLLFLDGSLADRCGDLAPEDFSSPLLGKIYGEQLQAAREGRTPAFPFGFRTQNFVSAGGLHFRTNPCRTT